MLFGDGAGAVVMRRAVEQRRDAAIAGCSASHLRSDGRYKDKLYVDGGPSSTGTVGHIRMEGREVYKHAVAKIGDVIEDAFAATGFTAADIDWFVPHQANVRIINSTAEKFGIPTRARHPHRRAPRQHVGGVDPAGAGGGRAATGASSAGDLLLIEAMGGGFTWGAAILRW